MLTRFLIAAALIASTAATASAECAWVKWNRMELDKQRLDWAAGPVFPSYAACRAAIGQTVYLDEPGSVRDWWLWLTRSGPYDPKRPAPYSKEFVGAIWTDDGAVSQSANSFAEFRCLPETMDPREAKAGGR